MLSHNLIDPDPDPVQVSSLFHRLLDYSEVSVGSFKVLADELSSILPFHPDHVVNLAQTGLFLDHQTIHAGHAEPEHPDLQRAGSVYRIEAISAEKEWKL